MPNGHKRTYRDVIGDLLDEEPELRHDREAVSERVGCSIRTANRYIKDWSGTRHIEWVMDRVTPSKSCKHCSYRDRCEVLDALELPVLCERVTRQEVKLAELAGTTEILETSREIKE